MSWLGWQKASAFKQSSLGDSVGDFVLESTLATFFFISSALNKLTLPLYWGSGFHFLLYRNWPFCHFDYAVILIKADIEISALLSTWKFQDFKCLGGGGFAYCNTFPQVATVPRTLQITENELYQEHQNQEKTHFCTITGGNDMGWSLLWSPTKFRIAVLPIFLLPKRLF